MTTFGTTRKTLIATLALGLACIFAFGTKSAAASEYYGGYHGGGYQQHCVRRVWVEGYYETVTQHVLVCAERTERRYFEPVYETRYHCGHPIQVCVRPGYYKDFCYPAQYADRCVKVWHPGFYREVAQY